MARLALNKSSLKKQRDQLKTYKKFLPSLDLKRQQLMIEWRAAQKALQQTDREIAKLEEQLPPLLDLLGATGLELDGLVKVTDLRTSEANVVGVRLPVFEGVSFQVASYSFLAKPFWVDWLVEAIQQHATLKLRRKIEEQRERLLEEAQRKITQRVNLFDKVLIPSCQENIRKINIFLADAQRVSVVRSKIAKSKNLERTR